MHTSTTFRNLSLTIALAATILLVGNRALKAFAQSPEQLQEGAMLYAENCAVCHGPNGEGRVGAALAKDWPSIRPELTVRTIIDQGVPGSVMPPWGQNYGGPFSDEQITALLGYILSWQTGGSPNLTPLPTATLGPPITPIPEVQGDPNRGAILYDQNCAMCHGPQGEGRIGVVLAQNWPGIRPDLSTKTAIENGVSGSVMPAWSQSNGGPLSESEINDIVAYVLSLTPIHVLQPAVQSVTPFTIPLMRGVGGILLCAVLLGVIILAAFILQRKKTS